MRFKEFIGPDHTLAAVQVDNQQAWNIYPELVAADGGTKAVDVVQVRAPGLAFLQTLPDSPNRGAFSVNGRCFAVAGKSFFELLSPTTATLLGSMPYGTSPVKIKTNGVQIVIAADGAGYVFTLKTNAWAQITDADFPTVADITVIDTYTVALSQNSNQFGISALLDASTYAGLDFGSSQEPDNTVGIEELHGYLWLFGSQSIVPFQDTGNNSFPFQRVPGGKIDMGLAAKASLCKLDNTIFWIGSSDRGPAVGYRADGFLPTRVSTHAVETAWQKYATVADATSYSYEERGHLFWRLDFPTAGASWLYDVATRMWHRRGSWDSPTGAYKAHKARFHAFCFGKHLVFDYASGAVYDQSLAYADDAGAPLRWARRAPHITDGQNKTFYPRFELLMNVGEIADETLDPQVFLRWSNDGGKTWGNEHAQSAGKTGEYQKRVIFRRTGSARSRVFEAYGDAPIPDLVLTGAELRITQGTS